MDSQMEPPMELHAAEEANAFVTSVLAHPQGPLAAIVLIGLAVIVVLLRCVPLTRRMGQDCEAGPPEYTDSDEPRPLAGIFPHTGPLFIGTPARLDAMTRLIRRTCPLRIAREPGKCGLCGQDVYQNDSVRNLPCGHSYHNLCVLRWFVLSRLSCPDCNRKISV